VSTTQMPGRLVWLGETYRTVADADADVRGRTAFDDNGDEIGRVEDLLVDEEEDRVRFLRIGSGGFLGLGREHFLVPVDAVTAVGRDTVIITWDRSRLDDVPGYDPDLADDREYLDRIYAWWGYGPYWTPGYAYPPFPYGV
jgi:sporulation protein YlmC with PRC-barrel domain